jgi:hypothetical protein
MLLFSEFIADLARRRSLRRQVDGGQVTYRLQLSGSSIVTIVCSETDPDAVSRVCSKEWPIAPNEAAHAEFMRQALNFNRNALHHLPCGIVPDPEMPDYYRLIWTVPAVTRSTAQWTKELLLFGTLTDKAWSTMSGAVNLGGSRTAADEASHMIFMP